MMVVDRRFESEDLISRKTISKVAGTRKWTKFLLTAVETVFGGMPEQARRLLGGQESVDRLKAEHELAALNVVANELSFALSPNEKLKEVEVTPPRLSEVRHLGSTA